MLQVLAVDGVDDAVGADELDGAVDADVDHRAALAVLGVGTPGLSGPWGHLGGTPGPATPRGPPPAGPGARDSRWIACAGPRPGAPRSGPPVSAGRGNTGVRGWPLASPRGAPTVPAPQERWPLQRAHRPQVLQSVFTNAPPVTAARPRDVRAPSSSSPTKSKH